jgi:hypothetical protein
VEKIVDEAQNADGGKLYRVRWMGYKPEEDTWEKEAHLPPHSIRRYERGLSRERRGDARVSELMHRDSLLSPRGSCPICYPILSPSLRLSFFSSFVFKCSGVSRLRTNASGHEICGTG